MLNDELNEAVKAVQEELNATEEEMNIAIIMVMSTFMLGFGKSLKERLIEQVLSTREFRDMIFSLPEEKRVDFAKEVMKSIETSKESVKEIMQDKMSKFVATGEL